MMPPLRTTAPRGSDRRFWLLLGAIVLIGAGLRFWQLDTMPPGLYHDEAYNGLDALSLLAGRSFPQFYEGWELYAAEAHGDRPPAPSRFPIFFEGNYGREPVHVYLMAAAVALFGPTPFALRAVPALAGVIAIVTTALAARALFDEPNGDAADAAHRDRIALVAAFGVATLFAAVHFSRFALRTMVWVPVETVAVLTFWRGYVTADPRRRRLWWLAAGGLIGFGLYIYAAARLFPLLFAGFIAIRLWREPQQRRALLAPFALLTGSAIIVALPLLLYFWRYPYYLFFRTAYVANRGRGVVAGNPALTYLYNVGRVVNGLFANGEPHLRHNLPGRAYLDLPQAILFATGAWHAVRRLTPRSQFLLLWLLTMLLPTILSGDAPHFGRMTGAAAPVAIMVGIGYATLRREARERGHRGTYLLALLAVSLLLTTFDYFVLYARRPALADNVDGFYLPDWQLGRAMAAEADTHTLYLAPHKAEMATLYFALGGAPDALRSFDASGPLLPLGRPDQPPIYYVRADFDAPFFKQPVLTPRETYQAIGDAKRVAPTLPVFEPAPAQPLGEAIMLEAITVDEAGPAAIEVTLTWYAVAPIASDLTAFVHLIDADGNLLTQRDRPPFSYPTTDWRPDERVRDTLTVPAPPQTPASLRTGFYDPATDTLVGSITLPFPPP